MPNEIIFQKNLAILFKQSHEKNDQFFFSFA